MTADEVSYARRKVDIFVTGFGSEIQKASGGGYFDEAMAFYEETGARVARANNGQFFTEVHNAGQLYEHILRITCPEDSVVLVGHSNGALAGWAMLRNPAYVAANKRVHLFIPINPPMGGSPLASLPGPLLGAWIGRGFAAIKGDRDVLTRMTPEFRKAELAIRREEMFAVARQIPVIQVASRFRGPDSLFDWRRYKLWAPNLYMRLFHEGEKDGLEGNDGAVLLRDQFLHGLDVVILENMSHGDTVDQTGPWDLRVLMSHLTKIGYAAMPEEMRQAGVDRSAAEQVLDAPHMEQDYVTRVVCGLRQWREAKEGSDLHQAKEMALQALCSYAVSSATFVGALVTLPFLFTGAPAVSLFTSAAACQWGTYLAVNSMRCAWRGVKNLSHQPSAPLPLPPVAIAVA